MKAPIYKCTDCGKVFTQDTPGATQVQPGQFEDEIIISCPNCGSDIFDSSFS